MVITFPTTEETEHNLRACEHGDPCQDCFVERSMSLVEGKFSLENGGKEMPLLFRELMEKWAREAFQASLMFMGLSRAGQE